MTDAYTTHINPHRRNYNILYVDNKGFYKLIMKKAFVCSLLKYENKPLVF